MGILDLSSRRQQGSAALGLVAGWLFLSLASVATAAPSAELWQRWQKHEPANQATIDHADWGKFLKRYISTEDGVNLLDYGAVSGADRQLLGSYLARLRGTAISGFARPEQMAFWINLYNALTVQVILDHYPVESITKIDISGLFSNGPWDADLIEIEGEELTLNDIEHRILRPIWQDPRIHYAVNCASIGCPNLQTEPFTSENLEAMLDQGAKSFVNHPRGARFEGNRLIVSNIYLWYREDFGNDDEGIVEHLKIYAEGELAQDLERWNGDLKGAYDWKLNEPG